MSKIFAGASNVKEIVEPGTEIPPTECGCCKKLHKVATEDTVICVSGFIWMNCECGSSMLCVPEEVLGRVTYAV